MYQAIKKLGQNFLNDITVAQTMVEALKIKDGDTVIEIGPGPGAVTEVLLKTTAATNNKVYAVELDERFANKLKSEYAVNTNFTVVHDDVLKFLPKFTPDPASAIHVIGSLPFYITSPIVHAIVKMQQQPETVSLLVQKEVAGKISADAPDCSYLSAFVKAFYDVTFVEVVPRSKFSPVPEVDGAVIAFTKKSSSFIQSVSHYEGFLHKAFKNPRKMLNKAFKPEELTKMQIDPSLRPQAVSSVDWAKAYNLLNS